MSDDGASFNLYDYNTRSEVVGADRYWGNDMNDTNNPVLAQGFGYEYDPIGNRKSAKGGTASSPSASYTANNLNQYTERTVSGKFPVLGSASEDAYVTVSLTNGTPEPADRQGEYWHKALEVDNTLSAVYPEIKVVGVYNPQSAGMPDIVSEEVGRKFIAKTPEQFTYDTDGNMLSDGRFNYTWDAENRLISVEESRSGVPAAFMKRLTFQYDYMSRRISKKLYRRQGQDWSSTPYKEIVYIYDGWNLICESVRETKSAGGGGGPPPGKGKGQGQGGSGGGGGGSVSISTNYYVWGLDLSGTLQGAGGIGGLLLMIPSSEGSGVGASSGGVGGGSLFPCYDGNGNVTELVSTNDAIAAHYEYSPFGETIASTGSRSADFPFRFSTKYLDAETGLYNYGYRYYSPALGRWLSRDPVGESEIPPLYCFVFNSPLLHIDTLGDSPVPSGAVPVSPSSQTSTSSPKSTPPSKPTSSPKPTPTPTTSCDIKAQQQLALTLINTLSSKLAQVGGSRAKALSSLIRIATAAKTAATKYEELHELTEALDEFSKSVDMSGCDYFCQRMYSSFAPFAAIAVSGYYHCKNICKNL